jgi:hypothetical protein
MRSVIVALGLLFCASAASAQPPAGVFGGYLYAHPDFEDGHLSTGDSLDGWLGGVDVSVVDHVGIVARADGAYGDTFLPGSVVGPKGNETRSSLYTVTAGPRVSTTFGGVTAFADALVGVAHGTARNMGIDFLSVANDTKFVGGAGGGVRFRLSQRVGVEADAQYRRTMLFSQSLNLVQGGASVVVNLRK